VESFRQFDLEFAQNMRNVHIGLATDGFTPFGDNTASYSCWPMFTVPYNLPPSLCMKCEFMFLCLIVPGPDHPGPKLNVMLKPLIGELKELWNGVKAYDSHKKQNSHSGLHICGRFTISWLTVFFGWSIHGRLTCLICHSDTDCFRLTAGGKISYFDNHQRWLPLKHPFRMQKDSFWKDTIVKKGPPKCLSGPETVKNLSKLVLNTEDNGYEGYGEEHNWTYICTLWEHPNAHALILMHNIDVMHQKCNVVESIISMCMDIMSKRKDNFKVRSNIAHICNHPSLELNERRGKRRAPFCLKIKDRKEVMR
jgi:hypothetical protein